jgi:hypothetical protein
MTELVLRIRRPVLAYLVTTSDGEQVGDLLTMNVRQHRVIGKLLQAGSASSACAVMREHITSSGTLMDVLRTRRRRTQRHPAAQRPFLVARQRSHVSPSSASRHAFSNRQ